MERVPDIYVYKMTCDNGGAPCVESGVLSLAICKPMIRRRAQKGDLVFGFGSKELGERLIYVAVVTEKPDRGSYYVDPKFSGRGDRIYFQDSDGNAQRRADAKYHRDNDQRPRDVGVRFERAHVLLSKDFRYFGANGTTDYRSEYRRVADLVRQMGRGHRVNFHPAVHTELLKLKDTLWRTFSTRNSGGATESDRSRLCNTSPSCAKIVRDPPEGWRKSTS